MLPEASPPVFTLPAAGLPPVLEVCGKGSSTVRPPQATCHSVTTKSQKMPLLMSNQSIQGNWASVQCSLSWASLRRYDGFAVFSLPAFAGSSVHAPPIGTRRKSCAGSALGCLCWGWRPHSAVRAIGISWKRSSRPTGGTSLSGTRSARHKCCQVSRPRFRSVGPVERAGVLVAPEYVAIDCLL